MDCSEVREHLSAYEPNTTPIEQISAHLEECDLCRAEQSRYAELQAALAEMEGTVAEPPAWLLASLTETTLERLRRTAALRATRRQIGEHRVAAGGAAILVAGVAGALVVGRSRRRSRRLKLARLVNAAA